MNEPEVVETDRCLRVFALAHEESSGGGISVEHLLRGIAREGGWLTLLLQQEASFSGFVADPRPFSELLEAGRVGLGRLDEGARAVLEDARCEVRRAGRRIVRGDGSCLAPLGPEDLFLAILREGSGRRRLEDALGAAKVREIADEVSACLQRNLSGP